jgi:antitoxin (DNA-binding transcriptional repressor) of toxin-antitoxin stability system
MEKISVSNARKDFSNIVNKVCYGGERIILQRQGKDCVAIVPMTDIKTIEFVEDHIDISEAQQVKMEEKQKDIEVFEDLLDDLGMDKR